MQISMYSALTDYPAAPQAASGRRNFAYGASVAGAAAEIPASNGVDPASFEGQLAAISTPPATAKQNAVPVTTTIASVDTKAAKADPAYPTTKLHGADVSTQAMADEQNDLDFGDLLDVLNPLQHIPLIGTLYRNITGDVPKQAAQVAGDVLYGALVGSPILAGVVSIASAMIQNENGTAPDEQIAELFLGKDDPAADAAGQTTKLAEAAPDASAMPSSVPIKVASTDDAQEKKAADKFAALETEMLHPQVAAPAVQTASANAADAKLASAAPAGPSVTGKVPFGGVMAPPSATIAAADAAKSPASRTPNAAINPQLVASGTRFGNTIYTSPMMRNTARVVAPAAQPATVASTVQTSVAQSVSAQAAVADKAMSVAGGAAGLTKQQLSDGKTLGRVMQDSARQAQVTGSSSNALPPDLVHDMMMMAMDKYKTASGLGPGSAVSAGMGDDLLR